MVERYAVEIIDEGRSGRIHYSEGGSRVRESYWEFGGGEASPSSAYRLPPSGRPPCLGPWGAGPRSWTASPRRSVGNGAGVAARWSPTPGSSSWSRSPPRLRPDNALGHNT
jgi:hypothetical protein